MKKIIVTNPRQNVHQSVLAKQIEGSIFVDEQLRKQADNFRESMTEKIDQDILSNLFALGGHTNIQPNVENNNI